MKDGIDHINDIYGRVSSLELEDRHGYREKIVMPFDMASILSPLYSTPDEPHFDAYMAQVTVILTKPIVAVPCLFSVLKGNKFTTGETEVWWGPMLPADGKSRSYLFPTPQYATTNPYAPLTTYQESALWSPDAGDYFRFGIKQPGDGGYMTAFIDWVPQKAFAP